ncbi:MAG: hypothetical protein QOE70_5339 [Chthoniobacter sp.]|nr:hypothetical protein [Chthoniobacter sp.]
MPKADSQKWALRLKKLCRSYDWTVTARGNDIIMQRVNPVKFGIYIFNAPPKGAPASGPTFDGTYRITLRFAPELSLDDYERLVVENEASEAEDRKLQQKYGITKRFGEISSSNEAKKQAYLEESKRLLFHWLPHFYAPDYSITFYQSWRWFEHLDSGDADVDNECNGIKEAVAKYFGNYNYLVAIGSSEFGYQETDEKN